MEKGAILTGVGGIITVTIQQKPTTATRNAIGERVVDWFDIASPSGWLDLMGGDSKYTLYNTKLQDSTHIFICDYYPIDREASDKRLVYADKIYDVLLIDDPMEMHEHLEIYLKFAG